MSSPRRIESSRINGAKSRGPKTPEGKKRSSQNAISHGLFADVTALPGECRDSLLQQLDANLDAVKPANELENDLVEQMTSASWRMRRTWAIECQTLTKEIAALPGQGDSFDRIAQAHANSAQNSNQLELMDRYEKRFHRIFHRCIHSLVLLRKLPPPPNGAGNSRNPAPADPAPPIASPPPAGQPPSTASSPNRPRSAKVAIPHASSRIANPKPPGKTNPVPKPDSASRRSDSLDSPLRLVLIVPSDP